MAVDRVILTVMAGDLPRGRGVPRQQDWTDRYEELARAPRDGLDADDLEALAVAAYLLGHDALSSSAWRTRPGATSTPASSTTRPGARSGWRWG